MPEEGRGYQMTGLPDLSSALVVVLITAASLTDPPQHPFIQAAGGRLTSLGNIWQVLVPSSRVTWFSRLYHVCWDGVSLLFLHAVLFGRRLSEHFLQGEN